MYCSKRKVRKIFLKKMFLEKYFSKNIFRKIFFEKYVSKNMFRNICFEKYVSTNIWFDKNMFERNRKTMVTPSAFGLPPNAENRNLEIQNLGVFRRPEDRTPAEKKIRDHAFRGLRKTE